MKATDRGWSLAETFIEFNNRELKRLSPDFLIGTLLTDMGEYDKAIKYFRQLLNQEPTPNAEILSTIFDFLGQAYYKKGNFNEAMTCFDNAFNIIQSHSELEYQLSSIFNHRTIILMEKCEYKAALTEFQRAIDIIQKTNTKGDMATLLRNMGIAKQILGNYEDALNLLEQSNTILQERNLHDKHENIAAIYINQAR